jgi:diguanylate cyclase (GGDEF)-like protein
MIAGILNRASRLHRFQVALPIRVVALVALLCAAGANAFVPAATVRLDGNERGALVTPSAQVLEDRSATLTFGQVRVAEGWQAGPRDALVFGFSNSVWWVRWRAVNDSDRTITAMFDLGSPRQDYVQWRVVRPGGGVEESYSGDRLPFAQRQARTRNFALPVRLAPHESVELYLRLQSYDGLFEAMPLKVFGFDQFTTSTTTENQVLTLFHGGLLALALYNLLLFFATRERNFGLYVAYLASFLLWSYTFRGYSFQYLWPGFPGFNNDILTVFAACIFGTIGVFASAYLRLRELAPRWLFNTNRTLAAINFLVIVPALLGYYAVGAGIGLVAGGLMAMVTLGTGIWLLMRGLRQAKFFVAAFALVGIGAASYILQIVAVLPTNWFTSWGMQLGSALEVLLLALGLADSMNTLKADKIAAERKAREVQEALNAQLAQQVTERTEALELSNRRLHELAITDEQTGAFNRRHFTAFCQAALAHREGDEPMAFCMFDLDHFKRFNERYGKPAGDAALRDIAQAVKSELRRASDVLFRLGGEEFGVLYTASSPDAAKQFVECLRAAIRRVQVVDENNPTGNLTATFGAGWWDNAVTHRLTPDQMYAVADNMLYEAKEAGRDRLSLEAFFGTGAHAAANAS